MKLNKIFAVGAIVALTLGLASCSKKQDAPDNDGKQATDTYVGLTIKFPGAFGDTRVAEGLPKDYNWLDEWEGQDKIETAKVYIVTDDATVNSSSYDLTKFNVDASNNALTPNIAVRANAGEKVKAYVILNDKKAKFITEVDKLAPAEFKTKFATVIAEVAAITDVAITLDDSSVRDIIVMTNDEAPAEVTIEPNVDENTAKVGTKNQMVVKVSRVTSRGIVTQDDSLQKELAVKMSKTIIEKNPDGSVKNTKVEEAITTTLSITNIEYRVSGGAKKVYAMKNIQTPAPTENGIKVVDDVYNFAPTGSLTWERLYADPTASASFLFNQNNDAFKKVETATDNTKNNVIAALKAEKTNSQFVLPVTHADGNYKKGNTTMFEIRVKFTAKNNTASFPDAEDLSAHTGTVYYYGVSDGFFYSTKEKAQMMDKNYAGGTVTSAKQQVKEYTNGYMYYYIWLNPNKPYSGTEKITMSPTVRNQVYHAHISSFKELGLANKDEIKPEDPLETDKTYLSVKLNVLPWGMHSYTVDLSNRY